MQNRNITSLKGLVLNQIRYYQEYDNPEPKNLGRRILGFFSARGATGRLRAKTYLAEVSAFEESQLQLKVFRDYTLVTKGLARSTMLRRRIGEGLGQYFGIMAEIERQSENLYGPMFEAAILGGGGFPDRNMIRDSVMERLLQREMEKNFLPEQITDPRNFVLNEMTSHFSP